MSYRRFHQAYSTEQVMGTNGRLACLQCGGDITAPRRKTFCSPKCADDFRLKTSSFHVRIKVLERDNGICAKCGKDVFAEAERVTGFPRRRKARGSGDLWQADHITPVAEGGGECGLEGYRTLCRRCHGIETGKLRRRINRRKREEQQPSLAEGLRLGVLLFSPLSKFAMSRR
jgi:5-methylcytosine-specific restriction enzyme A